MENVIEVKNLTKDYESGRGVLDVSFVVKKGEVFGFLGPNGAGKSTTMNMITGYLSSTSGTVTIDGCEILDDPIHAKSKIGYLPEIPPLYIDMTVKKYLEFMFDLKKVKLPKKEHIDEVMRLTKITEQADRIIKHLSKGYRQRVGLAQALLGNPPVIILDEPTAGLDPMGVSELMHLLRDICENEGTTIIMSTHDIDVVPIYSDYVYVINHGKLLTDGTPEEVFSNPTLLREHNLRLPRIAHLLEILNKCDKLNVDFSKATIGKAREEILNLIRGK